MFSSWIGAMRCALRSQSPACRQALIFCGALLVELAIFGADILTGSAIRLHTLYVFPVSLVALECERRWFGGVALVAALAFQAVTFALKGMSVLDYVVDIAVAALALLLSMTLAGIARSSRQRAIDLATTDDLTGIANRRALIAAIDAEIVRQARYGGVLSLAVIDLDGFKALNDTRGHHAGDDALRLLASILRKNVRESDLTARTGGDEFAILMPAMPAEECGPFCRHLNLQIARGMAEAGFPLTASIGSASFDDPPPSTPAALDQADAAMYRVKAAHRRAHPVAAPAR